MADDMFGDSALFDEFDREREPSGSFILYEKDEQGTEDKSKILFQLSDSSSSDEDGDDGGADEMKVDSVGLALEKIKKQNEKYSAEDSVQNGVDQNGVDSSSSESSDDDEPVVSKDRLAKSTSYKLNYERNKFKRYCDIIDSTRYVHEEKSPAVQILFQNNNFSRKYRTQIESFVRHLLNTEAEQGYQTFQKLDLKNTTPSCTELNDKLPIAKRTDAMWRAHTIIGCSQFYDGFVLDALGWPLVEYNPSLTESWDIPVYEQVFEDTLPIDAEEVKARVKKEEKARFKPKCWNCDGDHMMTECKLPRNQHKINENRQAMAEAKAQQQSKPQGPKSARYHKEQIHEEKTSKYRPGHLSKELREALGLGPDQLPLYIYKMRAMGYPPGWMEEAMQDPGLSMFDKDGNDIGEEEGAAPERTLNIEKIIEYPGFTVETPDNIIDEAGNYGLPPIQPHQLKSVLQAQTELQKESMKRQQEEDDVSERKRLKLDTSDMDLEDQESSNSSGFVPPLPPETPPSRPPLPENTPPATPRESPVPGKRSRETSEARSDSPSLEELEAQYQLLQQTLQEDPEDGELVVLDSCEGSQQSDPTGDTSGNPIDLDSQDDESMTENTSKNPIQIPDDSIDDRDFVKPKLSRVGSTSSIQTFGELGTGSPMSSQPGTPLPSTSGDGRPVFQGSLSVSKDFGTPILRRAGSYEALPQDSQFAEGIEDHIPFENLPDSTGTFEKMRVLIKKIRQKIPSRKKKKEN